MVTKDDFFCDYENKWCPGCGNFDILYAMKGAFQQLSLPPEKLLIVSGIGQAGKTPHFLKCNMIHGLHGRALPLAAGAKIANHELTIVVNSGDGDCYGEGGNHFMHAIRRNIDITLLVHDNRIYGLTKGQASPTTPFGTITSTQSQGVVSRPFNPLAVALTLGAGFVARGFSGDNDHLCRVIKEGIQHKGFSIIDIAQPCVSYNPVNTYGWYKSRVYDVEAEGHRPNDRDKAFRLASPKEDRIPVGVLYRREEETFIDRIPCLKDGPLTGRKYESQRLKTVLERI